MASLFTSVSHFVAFVVGNKPNFGSADYSTCGVYTKTIIHLSVGEIGGYFHNYSPPIIVN